MMKGMETDILKGAEEVVGGCFARPHSRGGAILRRYQGSQQ